MRRQIGAEVLQPQGLTNVAAGDVTNTTNIANLQNIALYSSQGVTPTFTAASTTLLSNAISNTDTAFTKAGLTGETTNAGVFVSSSLSGAIGILNNGVTKHYYFPFIGQQTVLSGNTAVTGPVIIYSNDGPQSSYVPYYLGGTNATASILFGANITGSSGNPTHVSVYVGGELASGDQIRILKASDGTAMGSKFATGSNTTFSALVASSTTASATELSSALYRKVFLIPTGNIASVGGMIVEFSSSAKTSTTPVAGVFVAISSGSYP
jgi:hypothetical protein